MHSKLTLNDLDVTGKRVLVRVDFNVPTDDQGRITDDTRIRMSLPTIEALLSRGASVVLMSHFGRPKGVDPKLSLKFCVAPLSQFLGKEVQFSSEAVGPKAQAMAKALNPGDVLLLENLRFNPAEEHPEKDPSFARGLASLGDCFVNDAFGTAHRAHSSTATIASYFPHASAAGWLMEKEIEALSPLVSHPKRPFAALIGGAKISTKIGLLKSLIGKVDTLYIGGGMIFTLLKAQGHPIGDSICDEEYLDTALQLLELARHSTTQLELPRDLFIASAIGANAEMKLIDIEDPIPKGWYGVDIGPQTIDAWSKSLQGVQSLFWNGPMGVVEIEAFSQGTKKLAACIASLKAFTVVGGGDSIALIHQLNIEDRFSHISTGGGASLEFIEFGHLPGIDALSDK